MLRGIQVSSGGGRGVWMRNDLQTRHHRVRIHAMPISDSTALRAMAALLLLRDKVVRSLLAAASTPCRAARPRITSALDQRYAGVHREMRSLFDTVLASPLDLHPQLFHDL